MSTSLSPTDPDTLRAAVHLSRFESATGVEELHLTVHPLEEGGSGDQSAALIVAYRNALISVGWDPRTVVFRRFFCDDPATQVPLLQAQLAPDEAESPCATSWVGQPPLPPAHMALWAHHVRDPQGPLVKAWDGKTLTLRREDHLHHWSTNLDCPAAETVRAQTGGLFKTCTDLLADRGLTLSEHVARTWIYVRDIDTNYAAMVEARRELFEDHGLTPETHYIASTGIQGISADPRVKVFMDAYAISRLRPEQVHYLKALENLSPTHVYGVTFERATAITYPDRVQVTISGTASIDANGVIMHPGDLPRQLDRTLENIEALLAEAGATLDAMQVFTVYLRHESDRAYAEWRMRERFADIPMVVVTGSVCRPGWLIEIEGEALFKPS